MKADRRAVALDLGGILLTDPTLGGFWLEIAGYRKVRADAAKSTWFSTLREPFERGELLDSEVWQTLADAAETDSDHVRDRFLGSFLEIRSGIQALYRAKVHGFRVVLATNHYHPWIPMWRDRFDWFSQFDAVVCSSEIGVRKPDLKFYDHVLQACGETDAPVYFVDDIEDNVAAASLAGFKGLLGDGTGSWLGDVLSNG